MSTQGVPFKLETWPIDADGDQPTLCTECGTPVRYGSRHTKCGQKVMGLEPIMTPTPTHTAVQPAELPKVEATAPERIYLVIGDDVEPDTDFAELDRLGGVTWCADKIDDNSIEYVRADLASLPAQGEQPLHELWRIALDYAVACGELSKGLQEDDPMWADLLSLGKRLDAMTAAATSSVAPCGQPLAGPNSKEGLVDPVVPPVEPSGATLSPGGHASDCATHNAPAYPPGPCDCLPTPQMCRAAVEYANGADVYDRVPREVLEIEEGIYAEIWRAMQAVAPRPTLSPCAASQWISVDTRLPPLNTEVLIAFDTIPLPATGQLTMFRGIRQWCWPAENDPVGDESLRAVTHWAFMRHPNEIGEWAQVDRGESSSEGEPA